MTGEPAPGQVVDVSPVIVEDALEDWPHSTRAYAPPVRSRAAWQHARAIATALTATDLRFDIQSNGTRVQLGSGMPGVIFDDMPIVATLAEEPAISTVEGSIETVYLHDRPHFELWDVIYRRAVTCFFDSHDLPKVREGLGKMSGTRPTSSTTNPVARSALRG